MRVGAISDCFVLPIHSLLCYPRQDGQGMDIAESWRIDVDTHMIRKSSYKGHGCKVSSDRLKIPFEGLTIPGAIFTVARTLEEASFRVPLPGFAFGKKTAETPPGILRPADEGLPARSAERCT